MPLPLHGDKKASESRSFLGPLARQNCLRILRPWHFGTTRSKSYRHATMAGNVFHPETNTHGTRLSHARTRQPFFDTTHKKWWEWKTNGSAVITGRLKRKRQGGGVSKAKWFKNLKNWRKKKLFFEIVLRSPRSGEFSVLTIFYVWCMRSQSRGTLASPYVYLRALRKCSSHLLLSASRHFIIRVLSACVICTLPNLGILWFSFV